MTVLAVRINITPGFLFHQIRGKHNSLLHPPNPSMLGHCCRFWASLLSISSAWICRTERRVCIFGIIPTVIYVNTKEKGAMISSMEGPPGCSVQYKGLSNKCRDESVQLWAKMLGVGQLLTRLNVGRHFW